MDELQSAARARGDWLAYYQFHAYLVWANAVRYSWIDSPQLQRALAKLEEAEREADALPAAQRAHHRQVIDIARYQLLSIAFTNPHLWLAGIEPAAWAQCRPEPLRALYSDNGPDATERHAMVSHLRQLATQLRREGLDADGEDGAAFDRFATDAESLASEIESGDYATAREHGDLFWHQAMLAVLGSNR